MHECIRGVGKVTRYNECKNQAARLITTAERLGKISEKVIFELLGARRMSSREGRRVGLSFRTDHVQTPKDREIRERRGPKSPAPYPDDPRRVGCWKRGSGRSLSAQTGAQSGGRSRTRRQGVGSPRTGPNPSLGLGFFQGNRRPLPELHSLRRPKRVGLWALDR